MYQPTASLSLTDNAETTRGSPSLIAPGPGRESAPTSIRQGLFFDEALATDRRRIWQGPVSGRPSSRGAACLNGRARGASGASGARVGRNLEEVTLEDRPSLPDIAVGAPHRGQLGCKVATYADGSIRAVVYRSRATSGKSGSSVLNADSSESESRKGPSSSASERSAASLQRSKRLVVHRARALNAQFLWTFTKRGKFESCDAVWAAWWRFARLMRKRFGKSFRYVAVPELHNDGETWHLHCLFDRFYMVESLRVMWHRALGGSGTERGDQTPGNFNAKSLRARGSARRRAAHYIAKYVGKGFERGGANRRVFSASAGLHPTHVAQWRCPVDEGIVGFTDSVGGWLREHFGLARAYPRFLFRRSWECAVIDTALPTARASVAA